MADHGGGCIVLIDRQKALNAINLDMYRYETWGSSVAINWLNAQKTLTLNSLTSPASVHKKLFMSVRFHSWCIVNFEVHELD